MGNTSKKPPTTLVEQVVQHADALTGQVKQLQKQLEQAELQVLMGFAVAETLATVHCRGALGMALH